MELTAVQQDALIELLNIGFGRAGAALSQLTGHRHHFANGRSIIEFFL